MSRSGRGFEDEARQRVIDAARRSGMSVGDLVRALAEPIAPAERPAVADTSLAGDFGRRLDELSERMRRLGTGERPAPTATRAPARASRVDAVDETALDEIAATVDRLSGAPRSRTRPAPVRSDETSRILETLEALDLKVRSLTEDKAPRRPARSAAETPTPARTRSKAVVTEERRPTRAETERTRPIEAPAPYVADTLDRQFRELGEKIEQLRGRDDRDGSAPLIAEIRALRAFIENRSGGGAEVSEQIRRLAGKIDRLAESRPERDVIEPLVTEIGRLRDVVLQSNFEGSLKSIEAGYGHIVDRLDDLKRGLAGPRPEGRIDAEISEIRNLLRTVPQVGHLSSLERNLTALTDKFERLATRDETPAAQQIERRLADLRTQIDAFDPAAVTRSLDQRLKAVTDKLDALERASRGPVASDRVITLLEELRTIAGGNRAADEIRALDARIAELGERIADFETRRPTFDDTDRLHQRIAEIAGKLDAIVEGDDGRRTTDALESAVARLDAAIAKASGPQADAQLDARFDRLLDRLDQRLPPDPTAEVESLTREIAAMRRDLAASRGNEDLEEQMRLLAERIDRSVAQDGDDEALAQIEEQLSRISGQIEATQDRFQDIGALEGHILKLAERMEDQHLDAVTAAREAAREMVRELAESREDGLAEEALRALQGDLRSLQSAARDTETRTNDTLISLHDALTGIVGRLTAIEKIAQGSARSAAAARNAAQAAETAAQAAVHPAPPAVASPFSAASPAVTPTVRAVASEPLAAPAAEPAPSEPTEARPTIAGRPVATNPIARARELLTGSTAPEDNRPLEPGSGKPTARPLPRIEPMAMPIADSAAPSARKADFIAAARRAAQAAAATTAPTAPVEAASATVQPGDRPAPDATAEPRDSGALARIGQVLKTRRRPLVLATAAVVLAILTLQMLPGSKAPTTKTADAEVKVEQTAPKTTAAVPATAPTPAPAESILTKTPTGEPAVGFSMPLATDGSGGAASAVPTTTPAPSEVPPQRTSALGGVPLAGEESAPTVTGSIPTTAATRPATPPAAEATTALPETIGPEALRSAAVAGDAKAAFEIGLRYAEGRTVPADLTKAVAWYGRAADKGLATAQYRLAVAYEKGLGVARDPEKSKALYKAAAEQGNVRAMHNLGVIYANARDMASAVPWFQKAADLGLKDSQFNLGIIHALGSGVKQDLAVSYKWFALAARQGDAEAEKKQTEVAGHLDKVNLAAARMAVQTWVQRPLVRAANDEVRGWGEPASAAAQPSAEDIVRQAQSLLKAKGFYVGTIDGDAGPSTKSAIRSFQKKAGLPQTGEIDPALMRALAGGRAL
ncbi:peptidoglycan-binding protein [Pinisolibacter aquiterrae]|uniref:peptidoglycan-binding protein n=1 Tax=Pinisolibacter aquiterrae TaxID=2815579 RepID=UPI001C3CAE83|nr:peptidoglycan-binding protein [Pinisolibacter aquiterrae]MBV5266777.1 SEL1-like repeat protein [Pinisolibacter aquiterrae]MCC8234910.1 peptidoglycan-binding protein [Pinisolibacter aquiterrae]